METENIPVSGTLSSQNKCEDQNLLNNHNDLHQDANGIIQVDSLKKANLLRDLNLVVASDSLRAAFGLKYASWSADDHAFVSDNIDWVLGRHI